MDYRHVEFSSAKSQQRIDRALRVFPRDLLMRLFAFTLHLLGAPRLGIAALLNMPPEAVKTIVRVTMRDGFEALRDRRRTGTPASAVAPKAPSLAARRDGQCIVVELCPMDKSLKLPVSAPVLAKTVLLTLVNAELLALDEAADVLGLHPAHCRVLCRKLANHDVAEALIDKRRGQQQDYRVGPEQKAELIQQVAARAITGKSTSSQALASAINERTNGQVSARSVRAYIQKLGLRKIKDTLPALVEEQKKNSGDC